MGLSPAPAPVTRAPSTPAEPPEPLRPSPISREVILPPRRVNRRTKQPQTASPISTEPIPQRPQLPLPSTVPPLSETDTLYFHTFQDQTASELSGFFDSVFYKERVLEACHTEPAIRHAATALGALYKTLEQTGQWTNGPRGTAADQDDLMKHWQVAFRQYSEACNAMLALTSPSQDSLRTQLMASVLLASFDSFIGDYKQAIVQIQSGLDLLERIRAAQRLPAYGISTETVEEELTIIFMRLAIQAKSYDLGFHFPEPYVVRFTSPALHQTRLQQEQDHHQQVQTYGGHSYDSMSPSTNAESSPISPSQTPSPPHTFYSLRDARIAHDRLNERMVRFQESLSISPKEAFHLNAPKPWLGAIASFKQQLTQWAHAFKPILDARNAPQVGRRERAGIAALQMAHLNAIVISAIQFNNTEMAFDEYIPVFQSIVDMGLEIVREQEAQGAKACRAESGLCPHQRQKSPETLKAGIFSAAHIKPTFSMDLGIVAPLYVVATKCRQPVLRRQAIELLSGSSRREGMWDSDLTARVGQWVMALEENEPSAHSGYGENASSGYHDPKSLSPSSLLQSCDTSGLSRHTAPTIPANRRVTVKTIDFDLRARFAKVSVGTRGLPDGVSDPLARSTRITW